MKDFILFMHGDAARAGTQEEWTAYFERLRASGQFQGGSAIGGGECLRKSGQPGPLHQVLGGYIRVLARDLEDAKAFVVGNPVSKQAAPLKCASCPRRFDPLGRGLVATSSRPARRW
jgi:hypothetical protein